MRKRCGKCNGLFIESAKAHKKRLTNGDQFFCHECKRLIKLFHIKEQDPIPIRTIRERALDLLRSCGTISPSLLQCRLKVSHSEACKLIEEIEQHKQIHVEYE